MMVKRAIERDDLALTQTRPGEVVGGAADSRTDSVYFISRTRLQDQTSFGLLRRIGLLHSCVNKHPF